MYPLITLLMAICAISLIAGFVKLAARLFRKTIVTWKQCYLFGLLLFVLTIAKGVLGYSFALVLPPILGVVLGLMTTLAIGSWFFSTRATTAGGIPIEWRGALQLTALAFGLAIAVCIPLFLLLTAILPTQV